MGMSVSQGSQRVETSEKGKRTLRKPMRPKVEFPPPLMGPWRPRKFVTLTSDATVEFPKRSWVKLVQLETLAMGKRVAL